MSCIGLLTCHAVALRSIVSSLATVQPGYNAHTYFQLSHLWCIFSFPLPVFPLPMGGWGISINFRLFRVHLKWACNWFPLAVTQKGSHCKRWITHCIGSLYLVSVVNSVRIWRRVRKIAEERLLAFSLLDVTHFVVFVNSVSTLEVCHLEVCHLEVCHPRCVFHKIVKRNMRQTQLYYCIKYLIIHINNYMFRPLTQAIIRLYDLNLYLAIQGI
jgi:hypothetical protein